MIDGKNVLNQPVKSNMRAYDNIRKIATGQGDDSTTGCLLDYNYFNKHYKMVVIDLSKQQAFDTDAKQYNKLILLEIFIEQQLQQCVSSLKKQK